MLRDDDVGLFFFLKSLHFIISGEKHLHHETPVLVQTLGGDQSKHATDPGPNSTQFEQAHVHTYC